MARRSHSQHKNARRDVREQPQQLYALVASLHGSGEIVDVKRHGEIADLRLTARKETPRRATATRQRRGS